MRCVFITCFKGFYTEQLGALRVLIVNIKGVLNHCSSSLQVLGMISRGGFF